MLINAYPIYARKKLSPLARYSIFHFLMKNKAFDDRSESIDNCFDFLSGLI